VSCLPCDLDGDNLSEAEIRIVQSFLEGSSLNEVARELYLSPNTVKTHRRTIYRKLGVSTRDEFIDRATELQIGSSEAID
jgi:LuxR family maltose regulon positive regulatory protein